MHVWSVREGEMEAHGLCMFDLCKGMGDALWQSKGERCTCEVRSKRDASVSVISRYAVSVCVACVRECSVSTLFIFPSTGKGSLLLLLSVHIIIVGSPQSGLAGQR